MDSDVGQSELGGLFCPVWCPRPFVPWDVLVLVFWWERSKGEGLYPVQGDGVFPGPVGQDVYARVPWYRAEVHVAGDDGRRERLAQGRGARARAGQDMVLTSGLVDAVNPSPTPQRVLLRAGFARCEGGTRAPGGGASCLGVGRPGLAALPRPTTRPSSRRPGPGTHWLWVGRDGHGDVSPTPQCALLRAGFVRCGSGTKVPEGVPLASMYGVWG